MRTFPLNATMATPVAATNTAGQASAGIDGKASAGSPLRHVADRGDAVLLEVEHGRHHGRTEHHEEWTGDPRNALQQNERDDHGDPEQQWRELDVAEPAYDVERALECVAVIRGDAGEVRELRDDHRDRDAGEVADEHGLGEEVGEEPQARQPTPRARGRRPPAPTPRQRSRVTGRVERVSVATADPTSSAEALSGPTERSRLVPRNA